MAGHHGIPANGNDRDREVIVGRQLEELKQKSQGMQDTAVAGYDQGPEVQASMSFEGHEDLDVQLEDVEPGDGGEGGNGHVGGYVEGDQVTVLAVSGRRRPVDGGHVGRHRRRPRSGCSGCPFAGPRVKVQRTSMGVSATVPWL